MNRNVKNRIMQLTTGYVKIMKSSFHRQTVSSQKCTFDYSDNYKDLHIPIYISNQSLKILLLFDKRFVPRLLKLNAKRPILYHLQTCL